MGATSNSEPINVIGGGNKITNFGLIESNNNAAIWFQDDRSDGANLSPGHELDQAGTLTINGNLRLSGNSFVTYNLGQSNTVGGPLNDLTNVKGDLVLDGYLLVTETTGGVFDVGTYRLFNYEGKLDDRGLEIGVAPGYKHHVQTSIAKQVNLIYSGSSALSFWDVDDGQSQSAVKTLTYGRPGSINGYGCLAGQCRW